MKRMPLSSRPSNSPRMPDITLLVEQLSDVFIFDSTPSGDTAWVKNSDLVSVLNRPENATFWLRDVDEAIRSILTGGGFNLSDGSLQSEVRLGRVSGLMKDHSCTVYWMDREADPLVDEGEFLARTCEVFEITTDMGKAALTQAIQNIQLLDRKQKDYGPGNISAFGEAGVLVRVNDKMERLKNLGKGNKKPNNESIADNWSDLANYGIIGQLCHAGLWQ